MNWFQRYGITGTYFLILALVWMELVYQLPTPVRGNPQILGAAFAAAFLPAGYLITVFAQWLYLALGNSNTDSLSGFTPSFTQVRGLRARAIWLIQRLHPTASVGGVMRQATTRARLSFVNALNDEDSVSSEHILEANSVIRLLTPQSVAQTEHFLRDWIARRTDVMAINSSIIAATWLAPIVVWTLVLLTLWEQPSWPPWDPARVPKGTVLFAASFGFHYVLWKSTNLLHQQVVQVLAAAFHKSGLRQGDPRFIVLVGHSDLPADPFPRAPIHQCKQPE